MIIDSEQKPQELHEDPEQQEPEQQSFNYTSADWEAGL